MSSKSLPPTAEEPRAVTRIFGLPLDLLGFLIGPIVLAAWINSDPRDLSDLGVMQHRLAGVMLLTVIWWLTEPIPIPATGLLAVGLAVILGVVPPVTAGPRESFKAVLAPFADPAMFFLMGGMFIGQAMMRHGLDRRFALSILCSPWAGRSPATVLGGVGLAVCLVSMFVSNTAATAMVYPVTMGLIGVMATGSGSASFVRSPYASALLLMTAYASSVGGIATPIGTTTNVVAMGYFEQSGYFGRSVDFLRWTAVGVPMMAVLFVALFAWMRLAAPPRSIDIVALRKYLRDERGKCGHWKRGEWNTLLVFVTAVTLWILPGILALFSAEAGELFNRHLPEEIVALLIPVMLYLLPVEWRRREFTLAVEDLRNRLGYTIVVRFGPRTRRIARSDWSGKNLGDRWCQLSWHRSSLGAHRRRHGGRHRAQRIHQQCRDSRHHDPGCQSTLPAIAGRSPRAADGIDVWGQLWLRAADLNAAQCDRLWFRPDTHAPDGPRRRRVRHRERGCDFRTCCGRRSSSDGRRF